MTQCSIYHSDAFTCRECEKPPWKWLESTRALQEEAYGVKYPLQPGTDELADSFMMNHSAAVIELSEVMQEIQWKPWAENRGVVNRDAAVKELVDVAHFIANMAVALGVTDEEWESRYQAKQELNRQRQLNGYDGASTKCPQCKAALDDVGYRTDMLPTDLGPGMACNACDARLPQSIVDAVVRQINSSDRCPGCGAVYGAPETRCLRDGGGDSYRLTPWCGDTSAYIG